MTTRLYDISSRQPIGVTLAYASTEARVGDFISWEIQTPRRRGVPASTIRIFEVDRIVRVTRDIGIDGNVILETTELRVYGHFVAGGPE